MASTSTSSATSPAPAGGGAWRLFIGAFVLALAIYAVSYSWIEHRRTVKGPWRVTFTNDAAGEPRLLINQPGLALTNVELRFVGQTVGTNTGGTLVFGEPRPVPYAVPYGQCLFLDTTFLPGTVALKLFGHDIELLPRVLVLDRQEYHWRSGATIAVNPR